MHFRIQKSIAAIHTKMYRACPQKRSRLSNFQPNGTIRESRCYTFVGSKRNLTPSHDERFPWGMSETSIVRWVLGICCLFLLFPGTKSSHSILILILIGFQFLSCTNLFIIILWFRGHGSNAKIHWRTTKCNRFNGQRSYIYLYSYSSRWS